MRVWSVAASRHLLHIVSCFQISYQDAEWLQKAMFDCSRGSCCQQLGLCEPAMRGTVVYEDQLLQNTRAPGTTFGFDLQKVQSHALSAIRCC